MCGGDDCQAVCNTGSWLDRIRARIVVVSCVSVTVFGCGGPQAVQIAGHVTDERGAPVAQARVRWKTGSPLVLTDAQGQFQLPVPRVLKIPTITAAHPDYFIGAAAVEIGSDGRPVRIPDERLHLQLRRIPTHNGPDIEGHTYAWVDPRPHREKSEQCGNCHSEIYAEWAQGAHATASSSIQFRGLYEGIDAHGTADVGWSLDRDYPLGKSVCWPCHVPSANSFAPEVGQLPSAATVAGQGVHCDFCHKIQGLQAGEIGLMHGRHAVQLTNPQDGQIFFGPLDDVDRGDDVFSPLQRRSELCAVCHEGVVFGVHVYRTYSEWLRSPAYQRGQQCQDCHMQPSGRMTNIAPGMGGVERDPSTLASHELLPGGRQAMLRRALQLRVVPVRDGERWRIDVSLATRDVGHHLPTGYIDRQIILDLVAFDREGHAVDLLSGPRLPPHAEAPLAGRAGFLFARVLREEEQSAPAPFWREIDSEVDDTLAPGRVWEESFHFPAEAVRAEVILRFRRFWKDVADEKHWPDDTVVVHRQDVRWGESQR